MVIFYKKWKKYNQIKLTKNKMDLNIRKMTNHPQYPDVGHNISITIRNIVIVENCRKESGDARFFLQLPEQFQSLQPG